MAANDPASGAGSSWEPDMSKFSKQFGHSQSEELIKRGPDRKDCIVCSFEACGSGTTRTHMCVRHEKNVDEMDELLFKEDRGDRESRRAVVLAAWKYFRRSRGGEEARGRAGRYNKYCDICSWKTSDSDRAIRHLLLNHDIDVRAEEAQKVQGEAGEDWELEVSHHDLVAGTWKHFRLAEGDEEVKATRLYRRYCRICSWRTTKFKPALRHLLTNHNIDVKAELIQGLLPRLQNVEEELAIKSPQSKQAEEELVIKSPPLKQVDSQIGSEYLRRESRRLQAAATWSHFRSSQGTERERTASGDYLLYCKICSWWTCHWEHGCKHLLWEHEIDVEGEQECIMRSTQVEEVFPIQKRSREEEPEMYKERIPNNLELAAEAWKHFHRTAEELAKKGVFHSMRCNLCLWPTLRWDHAQKHLIGSHGIDVKKQLRLQVSKRARVNEELPTAPSPLIMHNLDMSSYDTNISELAAQTDNAIISDNVYMLLSDTRIPTTPEQTAHDKAMTSNDVDMHDSNTNNTSVTPELVAKIERVMAAIPRAHLERPANGEKFQTREEALKRVQDWAFTQGFVVVTNISRGDRVAYGCTQRRPRTKTEKSREGCPWSAYISKRKNTGDLYVFGWSRDEHNHSPNPYPLPSGQHNTLTSNSPLKPSRATIESAASYRRPEKTLSKQEEISQILHHLKKYDFIVQVRYDSIHQDVAKDVFFISQAQIELGLRFVSGFMYQIDTTFHTEGGCLPLYSMIGVTNTGHSVPFAYCYITSESAVSFEFVARQLTKYVFNGLPEAEVIIADFSRGLGAAIAAKARSDSTEDSQVSWLAGVLGGDQKTKIRLQFSESHATEALKQMLVHGELYDSRKRKGIEKLVDDWIKAPANGIFEAREKLLEKLEPEARERLVSQYQQHEVNFLRAYTRTYRNLGCDSIQRNACCQPITKRILNPDQPISKAIEYLAEDLRSMIANHQLTVSFRSVTLDMTAFRDLGELLTSYCLEKAMPEWAAAKSLAREEAHGLEKAMADWATAITPEEVATVDGCLGCMWTCELPLRYGIPCRHWMYPAIVWKCQLPASLFHPRWFHDGRFGFGPRARASGWKMSWGTTGAENEYSISAKGGMTAGNTSAGNLLEASTENESNMNTGNNVTPSAGEKFENVSDMSSENGSDTSDEIVVTYRY